MVSDTMNPNVIDPATLPLDPDIAGTDSPTDGAAVTDIPTDDVVDTDGPTDDAVDTEAPTETEFPFYNPDDPPPNLATRAPTQAPTGIADVEPLEDTVAPTQDAENTTEIPFTEAPEFTQAPTMTQASNATVATTLPERNVTVAPNLMPMNMTTSPTVEPTNATFAPSVAPTNITDTPTTAPTFLRTAVPTTVAQTDVDGDFENIAGNDTDALQQEEILEDEEQDVFATSDEDAPTFPPVAANECALEPIGNSDLACSELLKFTTAVCECSVFCSGKLIACLSYGERTSFSCEGETVAGCTESQRGAISGAFVRATVSVIVTTLFSVATMEYV